MSSASVTSSKRERLSSESPQELESIRSLNSCLKAYLEHLQLFKQNLMTVNENCMQLSKVNSQWIDALNSSK